MAPARCLSRRWRLANDEYVYFEKYLTMSNIVASLSLLGILPVLTLERLCLHLCFSIACICLLYDTVLCRWSKQGWVNDVEAKRKGLNTALAVRFLLALAFCIFFWYDCLVGGGWVFRMKLDRKQLVTMKFGWEHAVALGKNLDNQHAHQFWIEQKDLISSLKEWLKDVDENRLSDVTTLSLKTKKVEKSSV